MLLLAVWLGILSMAAPLSWVAVGCWRVWQEMRADVFERRRYRAETAQLWDRR